MGGGHASMEISASLAMPKRLPSASRMRPSCCGGTSEGVCSRQPAGSVALPWGRGEASLPCLPWSDGWRAGEEGGGRGARDGGL